MNICRCFLLTSFASQRKLYFTPKLILWEHTGSLSIQESGDTVVKIHKIERATKLARVKVEFIEHEADYMKLQILQEYGGSILDFDVIVINGTWWREKQKISVCILSVEDHSFDQYLG